MSGDPVGMESLFHHVFAPNPSLVSDAPGTTEPGNPDVFVGVDPSRSPGPVKIKVTRIWVDDHGDTWAEGEIPQEDLPPYVHRIEPPGEVIDFDDFLREHQHVPMSVQKWDQPSSNPIEDIRRQIAIVGGRSDGKSAALQRIREKYPEIATVETEIRGRSMDIGILDELPRSIETEVSNSVLAAEGNRAQRRKAKKKKKS